MLDKAVLYGNIDAVKALIEKHDVSPVGHYDDIHALSVQSGNVAMAEYIETHAVNPGYLNESGQTLAHWAVRTLNPDMIDYVDAVGVDLNGRTFSNETMAHQAVYAALSPFGPLGLVAVLEHMRKKGIDLNAVDTVGRRIFDILEPKTLYPCFLRYQNISES